MLLNPLGASTYLGIQCKGRILLPPNPHSNVRYTLSFAHDLKWFMDPQGPHTGSR